MDMHKERCKKLKEIRKKIADNINKMEDDVC